MRERELSPNSWTTYNRRHTGFQSTLAFLLSRQRKLHHGLNHRPRCPHSCQEYVLMPEFLVVVPIAISSPNRTLRG